MCTSTLEHETASALLALRAKGVQLGTLLSLLLTFIVISAAHIDAASATANTTAQAYPAYVHALTPRANLYSPKPATTNVCGKSKATALDFAYCVFPATDPDNKDLIIHLHGLGGNANNWMTDRGYQRVRQEYVNAGRSLPTVVAVSLGNLWLVTEVAITNNRYGALKNEIIPFLEKLAGFSEDQGQRILLGESMGGFNALQIFFRNQEMFAKVAVICPAVADLSPWSTEEELYDFIRRTGAQSIRVAFFMDVAADEFPTPLDWETHNPLLLASQLPSVDTQFYLSADERDEYGFFEGAVKLNALIANKFSSYQWDPIPNGLHCYMNPPAIAEFLMR